MNAKDIFLGEGIDRMINFALYGATAGGAAAQLASRDKPRDERIKELLHTNPISAKEFVAKYAPELGVINQEEPGYHGDVIATPKEANQYALAHEVGHHEYAKTHKPISRIENLLDLDILTNKRYDTEKGAWDNSPIDIKDEGEELRNLTLEKYKKISDYFKIGTGAGALIGALATIPHLLKRK